MSSLYSNPAGTLDVLIGGQTVGKIGSSTTGATSQDQFVQGSQLFGFRNKIINGGFRVAQRGTSFTPALSTIAYTADRWFTWVTGAIPTVSAVSSGGIIGGFNRGYIATVTNAAGSTTLLQNRQRIEASLSNSLSGQVVTVSGWVYQNTGSTQSIYVGGNYITGTTDNWATATSPITAVASNNTVPTAAWTYFTATLTMPTMNMGLEIYLQVGATGALGQSITFSMSEIQLEAGSLATPFEQRPYGLELSLCQRYYELCSAGSMWMASGANSYGGGICNFRATKFSAPTVTRASDVIVSNTAVSPYAQNINTSGFLSVSYSTGAGNTYYHTIFSAVSEL